MTRVLVTGATGFLGRHLVDELLRRGDEVVALCRRDVPELAAREGVTVARGDVMDFDSVKAAAEGCEGLYHLAGRVSRKKEDASALLRLHMGGTETTLRAAWEAGIRRVVYLSTSGTVAVSADPDRICNEDDETPIGLIQRWPYYRSKLFAEEKALELGEELEGLEVVSINPTLLLGPGDVDGSSTEDVRRFLEGKVPAVPPGGLSYVDVRDVAALLPKAMARGEGGRRYLVGACNITLSGFFRRLARLSDQDPIAVSLPRLPGVSWLMKTANDATEKATGKAPPVDAVSLDMAQYYWYLDATRAETELGLKTRDPLDTLADTADDLYARGAVAPREDSLFSRLEEKGREVIDSLTDRLRERA